MTGKDADSVPERQVIFVGGTSYSGSTMLDMMLANGEGGFSCGEIAAAFSPYRKHHFAYTEHSAADGGTPWKSLIGAGPRDLYRNIFALDSGITRIIDSSKDPIWIHDQTRALRDQGIRTANVIIWKRPVEFLASMSKRGRQRGWQKAWTNYHKLYFRLVHDWVSVSYHDLVTNEAALARVCRCLSIPYFRGKEAYWQGSFQTLFGNDSAKIHLSDQTGEAASTTGQPEDKHRQIYYEAPDAAAAAVDEQALNPAIIRLLKSRDAITGNGGSGGEIPAELLCSVGRIRLKRLRRQLLKFSLSIRE